MPVPMGPGTKWRGTKGGKFTLLGANGKVIQRKSGKFKKMAQANYAAQTKRDFAEVAKYNRMGGAKRGAEIRRRNRARAARKAGRRAA